MEDNTFAFRRGRLFFREKKPPNYLSKKKKLSYARKKKCFDFWERKENCKKRPLNSFLREKNIKKVGKKISNF